MSAATARTGRKGSAGINRVIYALFVMMGLIWSVRGNIGDGLVYLSLALVFDPFDQKLTWGKRPFYQRAWLIIHLALVLLLFIVR